MTLLGKVLHGRRQENAIGLISFKLRIRTSSAGPAREQDLIPLSLRPQRQAVGRQATDQTQDRGDADGGQHLPRLPEQAG